MEVRYAVTTRSRLRGVRFFPAMYRASARVKQQVERTPGCPRFASVVGGPREFWSLSVWRSREEMQGFMRTGEHEAFMWNFSRWFDSFWLMRWRPTPDEVGGWDGLALGPGADPARPDEVPEDRLDAFQLIPELREAALVTGSPSYEGAPVVQRARRRVAGVEAITIRIRVPRALEVPLAARRLRQLTASLEDRPDVLRSVSGTGGRRELYGLVLGLDREPWVALLGSPLLDGIGDRWSLWMMRWEAAGEFGHWDGLRLRAARSPRRAAQDPAGEDQRHRRRDQEQDGQG